MEEFIPLKAFRELILRTACTTWFIRPDESSERLELPSPTDQEERSGLKIQTQISPARRGSRIR
jgi:hypothetical protein